MAIAAPITGPLRLNVPSLQQASSKLLSLSSGSGSSRHSSQIKAMAQKNSPDRDDDPIERAREFLTRDDDERWRAGEWMSTLLPHLDVTSADPSAPARVTFSFTCLDHHCNRLGNLHGGAAATLFDLCTTMPLVLIGKPGFWQFLGVTRNLNVSYFRPVPKGEEVVIETEAVQVGKRLATLKGVMRRKRDGEIVSICEHLKANIDPEPKI